MHRPHFPVALLGHRGHGKSTLAAALAARVDARPLRGDPHDVRTCRVPVTSKRITILDVPGGRRSVNAALRACAVADAAVLVVSSTQGPQSQTRDHVLAAKAAGLSPLIVVINDRDGDKELVQACEHEVRSLLIDHGEGGDDAVVIVGSVVDNACVDAVIAALEAAPIGARDDEASAVVRVLFFHEALSRRRGGVAVAVASGRVVAGRVKPDDVIRIVGVRAPHLNVPLWTRTDGAQTSAIDRAHDVAARVVRVEIDNDEAAVGAVGEHVGLELVANGPAPHVDRQSVVLVASSSAHPARVVMARLTLRPAAIGGRTHPLLAGFECLCWTGSSSTACVVLPYGDGGSDAVGDVDASFDAAIILAAPRYAAADAPVVLTGGGGVVATGVITSSLVQRDSNPWLDRLAAVRAARANRSVSRAQRRARVNA